MITNCVIHLIGFDDVYMYLYRCTVHSAVYLINTPTNALIYII